MKMMSAIPAMPVVSIDKAVSFYTSKMGFHCAYSEKKFAKITRGHVEIHLWAACDYSWRWRSFLLFAKPILTGAETFLAGTASCRIQVDDVNALYAEYQNRGVLYSPKTVVETTTWGTLEFPTLDLHCNLITFFERVK